MSVIRRGATGLLVLIIAAGCSVRLPPTHGPSDPSNAPASTLPPIERPLRFGEPIELTPEPPTEDCDLRLRSDFAAAQAIRENLGIDDIATDPPTVERVAGDPTADLFTLGIPLLPADLAAIRERGYAFEPGDALTLWVKVGRPDLFGGVWIDPAGGNRHVVSVVDADPLTVALGQCLAGGADVRYVVALTSYAEGQARQDAVTNQIPELQAIGIGFSSVSYKENEGVLEIGLIEVTPEAVAELRRRFGDDVRVIQRAWVVPL
jgi:hypothetical protein